MFTLLKSEYKKYKMKFWFKYIDSKYISRQKIFSPLVVGALHRQKFYAFWMIQWYDKVQYLKIVFLKFNNVLP